MPALIMDSWLQENLIRNRQELGHDLYDEVWEGVYVITSPPDNQHQGFVADLNYIFQDVIGVAGLGRVRPGVNLSEHEDDWKDNYRVPDVAVFLKDTSAKNCDTHWVGAADFLVEITSPYDKTREKLPFYEKIGTRELLLIDRAPWQLELYRLNDQQQFELLGKSTLADSLTLASTVVPLSFRLIAGDDRPRIEVTAPDGQKQWRV